VDLGTKHYIHLLILHHLIVTQDAFNAELTFSVIIRDTTSAVGYSTLDIECEAVDTYYLLLRGFRWVLVVVLYVAVCSVCTLCL